MSNQISEKDKLKAEQEAKSAEEKRIAEQKAEAEAKKNADEQAKAALDALGVNSVKALVETEKEAKPKSNMDMLREQQAINERINYQAAKVKGQTFVRGK